MDVALPADFREFLASLNANGVEYLLIGGYAVGFYGYPRATNDIDVWVRICEDNAQRIVAALVGFGFSGTQLAPELFLKERNIVRMGRPPLRIEVATSISGVSFEECYEARQTAVFDGVEVPVISREDLLTNKRASGRPKDLADVDYLTRQRRPRRS